MGALIAGTIAPQAFSQQSAAGRVEGTVLDSAGKPVGDASVLLQPKSGASTAITKTNLKGAFAFSTLHSGTYTVIAEKSGLCSRSKTISDLSEGDRKYIDLVLEVAGDAQPNSSGPSGSATAAMEFADQPNFAVAGVTDWTAVGGHGSDSSLRTSESLARETLTLKSEDSGPDAASLPNESSEANKSNNKLQDKADLHRSQGDEDEKLGDPLAAIHEYEQAVRLNPDEQNYFTWGSELLLHRAVWQAQEVFEKGAAAFPQSVRMLTALGAALFASAHYDEAAIRLCNASDLNPAAPGPYIFLGKVGVAAPEPLPCVERKLARFAQEQPGNSLANYFYAMSILKRQEQSGSHASPQAEALLTKAVKIDPKCGDAYLQLGILDSFQRDYRKAIGFYTKAIEVDPQLGDAYYRLGMAYDRIGERAKAKEQFRLHDELEKQQADAIERQRREVKQFLVVLQGQSAPPQAH